MKEQDVLIVLEAIMQDCQPDFAYRWTILVRKGQILCLPVKEIKPMDRQVMPITRAELKNGLVSSKWNLLDAQLRFLVREGVII